MSQTPEILPLRCGTIRVPAHDLETNSAGDLVLPVYAYLITHPSGRLALFDAGLARSDDGKTLVDAFYNELPEGHDVAARVTAGRRSGADRSPRRLALPL